MRQSNGTPAGDDADANEHTSLLSRPFQSSDGHKPWEDSRRYIRWPAIVGHTTWEVLISNYVNVLLVFVPLGIISGLIHWNPTVTFVLNFLAIVPLASLLSFATEELSLKLGQTLGGLLNASFGNAVELIVGFLDIAPSMPLTSPAGQYCCAQKWRDSDCAIQHAWIYPIKHTPCSRMLLCRRRS